MRAVVDTSVVLRVVFGSHGRLDVWGEWDEAYASELMEVEALRRLGNARLEGLYDDESMVEALEVLREILDNLILVGLTSTILERASGAFRTVTGTLDALHLATALALVEAGIEELVFATHDEQQGRTAIALGLQTIGLKP